MSTSVEHSDAIVLSENSELRPLDLVTYQRVRNLQLLCLDTPFAPEARVISSRNRIDEYFERQMCKNREKHL